MIVSYHRAAWKPTAGTRVSNSLSVHVELSPAQRRPSARQLVREDLKTWPATNIKHAVMAILT
jgi:hypothetical protein